LNIWEMHLNLFTMKGLRCDRIIVWFLMPGAFFTACQQPLIPTRVQRVAAEQEVSAGSFVYVLPRTVVRVSMEITRHTERQGPFHEYREQFLNISEGLDADRVWWNISNLQIETRQEIDPQQYYVVEPGTYMESDYLALSRSGLVLTAEEGVAGELGTIHPVPRKTETPLFFPGQAIVPPRDVTLEWSYTIEETDSGFVRVPFSYEKVRYRDKEEMALEAADFIIRIRERRADLLDGMAEEYPDGKALELLLEEMDRAEKEYLALFTGKILKETFTVEYDVIPTTASIQTATILCWFSEEKGLVNENEPGGIPVALDIRPETLPPPLEHFGEEAGMQDTTDCLVYRIPDVALLRVTNGKQTLAMKRALIYQLGKTVCLPVKLRMGK